MTTNLQNYWFTSPIQDNRIYVDTPQGRGYVLLLTPLAEQIKRNAIAVMLEGAERCEYFSKDEVQFEGEDRHE